ncbi:MAG TPA: hypothetical protein PKJ99_15935 [Thermoanaerobaculales bacterium]|nr:hypothetical protein [Thermoanaerobaculales bacterium]HQL30914.1 hypothetical protein [Thermoanaerobaculales bacterium]HQP44439.1 hypothetical protein [Thermoanaerobaculales bacterium]
MKQRIVPVLVLVAGLLMAFHPTILSGFARLQTDLGDTRLNNYLLEHGWRWLSGEPGVRLWHPPFFYPAPNVLAYSDLLLTFGPLYWPWRALGLGEVASFQLWMIGLAVANFAVAYLFLRRAIGLDRLGAALGSFVISFAASRVGQLGHQQMLAVFFVLGALWAICSMIRTATAGEDRGRGRLAPLAFGGCLVAQLYGSYYNLAFSLAALTLAVLAAFAVPGWRRALLAVADLHWRAIAAAGCLAVILALPAAVHYLEAAGTLRPRPAVAALGALPRLASYVFVDEHSWCYGWMDGLAPFRSLPVRHEHAVGLGFLTTGILLLVAWRTRTHAAVRLAAAVVLGLGLLVTMFPGGHQLWTTLYRAFPPFQGLRAVSRIGMLLSIPAGISVGWLVSHRGAGTRARLVIAVAILACLEQGVTTRSVEVAAVEAHVDELAALVDRSAEAVLVVPLGPVQGGWPQHHLHAMWAARRAGVATINGYTGNRPPGWDFGDLRIPRGEGLDEVRRRLDSWAGTMGLDPARVQILVVGGTRVQPEP